MTQKVTNLFKSGQTHIVFPKHWGFRQAVYYPVVVEKSRQRVDIVGDLLNSVPNQAVGCYKRKYKYKL